MKYVLDASVALKWVLDEPNVERARMLRAEFENFVTELIAPDHFAVEIAHVLGTARYKGQLTAAEADAYFDDLMTSLPEFVSSRLLSLVRLTSRVTRGSAPMTLSTWHWAKRKMFSL